VFTWSSTRDRTRAPVATGSAWKQVPSPSPPQSGLADAAATSASNAWAVGSYGITHPRTMILRWNGTT
jgi:hypothetical protein